MSRPQYALGEGREVVTAQTVISLFVMLGGTRRGLIRYNVCSRSIAAWLVTLEAPKIPTL